MPSDLRILIVAEHASARFGGEAILPVHYFRVLRGRGVDVRMVVHARTREELARLFPADLERITFIPDSWLNVLLWRLEQLLPLPSKVKLFTLGWLSRLHTQRRARRAARALIRRHGIQVVHQPIPVSPREPSILHGLGVPVVIGPMNGGMSFPPGFWTGGDASAPGAGPLLRAARRLSGLLHVLMPGKRRAQLLLVANERTRRSLPPGVRGRVVELVENGVDLKLWQAREPVDRAGEPVRFVFSGRLVSLKAVDLLIRAVERARREVPLTLDVVGDGPERGHLEEVARSAGQEGAVRFHGWLEQPAAARVIREADALVLPSLHECGGAVVLEAMATGLPVIATDWGGPADYVDPSCGILVPARTPEQFVGALAEALLRLAHAPELRRSMGRAGREKVCREFDWERKGDRILQLLEGVAMADTSPAAGPTPGGTPFG
jgi:glycosyltransferase involved in cell wall biosynthesis